MRALVLALFLASGGTAVVAALTKRRRLLGVTKPLTTLLLFMVAGAPASLFGWWIDIAILLSLVGDVALLGGSQGGFLIGLASFLCAHLAYIVAFTLTLSANGGGQPGIGAVAPALAAAAVLAPATAVLLRLLWPGAAGLRLPVVVYGVALAGMVVAAAAATGGGSLEGRAVPWLVLVGAALFYVSDASLALDRFRRPFRLAPVLTLGVYWLGQLCIAAGARALAPI